MNYKTSKILAYIIVIILYVISILVALGVIYTGLNSLIGLITAFNIKDLVTFLLVVIFFYWIIKTSWHIIRIRLLYT